MTPLDFVQFRIAAGKISYFVNADLSNEVFLAALKDAAPEFYQTLDFSNLSEAQQKTLYKYFSRWCTRPTPFGKFSGVFSADLTNRTHFKEFIPKFYTEPDILEKKKLADYLNQTQLEETIFFVNTSLYPLIDKYDLIQSVENNYKKINLERFNTLDTVINSAQTGVSYRKLLAIIEEAGFSTAEADEVICELLEEQVLTTSYAFFQSETLTKYKLRQKKTFPKSTENYTFTVYPDAEINKNIIDQIVSDVNQLGKLFVSAPKKRLAAFRDEFLRRYEGQKIPLLQALDPEHGINYGSYNLLQQSEILNKLNNKKEKELENNLCDKLLLKKYIECLKTGKNEVIFSEEDLQTDAFINENTTSYIFGSLLKGGKFHLKNIGGSSAVNLMSRFSLGNEALASRLRKITAFEQSETNAVLAEVIHLPEGKIGNVVLHAPLRTYHIPYLGQEKGNSIPLNDLMISVEHNEVVIHSKKHNSRIIPCLSHAHNYTTGLPIYCFLGDLQSKGKQFSFNWGVLADCEYLPRITFKNLILARAEWNLTQKNFGTLLNKLPRHLVIVEDDNELYLDMQQSICKKILEDYLRKNKSVKVQEFLQTPENCFINNHTSEIVIPVKSDSLTSNKRVGHSELNEGQPDTLQKQSSYPPGSQWLYFKIYTGFKTADKLLRDKIKPLIEILKKEELIEKWFFIRYQDPDFHLRLRFYHGSNTDFYKTVLELFYAHFQQELSNGTIHDLILDTYKPEYSRYTLMQESESLFMKDSELVLGRLESDEELYRIETSLSRIHELLSGLTFTEKTFFCLNHRDSFLEEFGQDFKPELNKLYRHHFPFIKNILNTESDTDLLTHEKKALSSYIHMHVNRNFISESRKYEMVLYHFLYRYYTSIQAQKDLDLTKNK